MNAKVTLTQRGMQSQSQPPPPTQEQIDATNAQFQDALESGTHAIKLRKQWSQSILLRGNAAANFYTKLGVMVAGPEGEYLAQAEVQSALAHAGIIEFEIQAMERQLGELKRQWEEWKRQLEDQRRLVQTPMPALTL